MSHYWGGKRVSLSSRMSNMTRWTPLFVCWFVILKISQTRQWAALFPLGGGIIFAQPKSLQMFDPLQHFHLCIFINMQSRDSWNCTSSSSASWTWCHMKLLTSLNYLPHSKFLLLTLHWPPGGRSCQAQMLLVFFCIMRIYRRVVFIIESSEFSAPTFSHLSLPSPDSHWNAQWISF